jgi:hypothetical protein
MVSSTVDHMVSLIVFIGALLLFIGLFSQTIQTGIIYQNHRTTATKASDMLDTILLSPGVPSNWGFVSGIPSVFGLQDSEFTQYVLNPFSIARLMPYEGTTVYYQKTGIPTGLYSSATMASGSYFLMPNSEMLSYVTVAKMLGVNATYGFQLVFTPLVSVTVTEIPNSNLSLSIQVDGASSSLSNATINYTLITVSLSSDNSNPNINTLSGTTKTDIVGNAVVSFSGLNSTSQSYAFFAYAHIGSLTGLGYTAKSVSQSPSIVPLMADVNSTNIVLAHSYDLNNDFTGQQEASTRINFNTTMLILTEDYALRELPLSNNCGNITNGQGYQYGNITIPTYNQGIIITAYNSSATETGISIMPWGLPSLGETITFGGDSTSQEWVATDLRQVLIGSIAYQAKIFVWSFEETTVTS